MLYGVDVHGGYQAGLNFKTLAAQGYSFAVMKATEGIGYMAPNFPEWVKAAQAAGMVAGAYHWLRAGNAAEQARYFYARVKEAGGPEGLLIQLDCEDNGTWADVKGWAAEWNKLSHDHPFLIYSGAWWWGVPSRNWNGAGVTPYLWQSHYIEADADVTPDDPAKLAAKAPAAWWRPGYGGWPVATILQFTSKGDAGSLGNNVDLNAFRGTREELLALTGGEDMADSEGAVAAQYRLHGLGQLQPVINNHAGNKAEKLPLVSLLLSMAATLKELSGKDLVDEDAIANAVLAGIGERSTPEIVAALRAVMSPEALTALAKALTAPV